MVHHRIYHWGMVWYWDHGCCGNCKGGLIVKRTLERAIAHYGEHMQMVVAMEEMSELQKELAKAIRGKPNRKAIAEEIADVEIMLEQIKIMFKSDCAVKLWKIQKIERLNNRMEADSNGEK